MAYSSIVFIFGLIVLSVAVPLIEIDSDHKEVALREGRQIGFSRASANANAFSSGSNFAGFGGGFNNANAVASANSGSFGGGFGGGGFSNANAFAQSNSNGFIG